MVHDGEQIICAVAQVKHALRRRVSTRVLTQNVANAKATRHEPASTPAD